MATYFHVNASELQGGGGGGDGGMQTLYLMNPNYAPYLDHHTNNTLLLNPVNLSSHAPPPPPYDNNHQPLVGIPLPAADDNIHQYDLWSSIPQIPSAQNNNSQTHMASLAAAFNNSAPSGLLRPLASVPSRQQGLSLSLSSQDQQVEANYNKRPYNNHDQGGGGGGQVTVVSAGDLKRVSESSLSPSSVSVVSSGNILNSGMQILTGSKYLKAAQELLDEVVKVENLITLRTDHRRRHQRSPDSLVKENIKKPNDRESDDDDDDDDDDDQESNGAGESKILLDLTTSQRQELQVKKAKLMNMLDEVEQRYKQYHQQMQSVVSAFDQAAGFGSAKSYTALALRTISKQFRSLKDAISTQIKAATKKLGEDECLGAKGEGSRLRFVDQQLRQQRAFQHLGMMQQHAWRPQRGLPERAVTILRAWLFEHFLHPYPKDLDKQQLAKQTGLTRSQVSNWFINARVRLWKPMVEDMYLEEVKEQQERNGNSENTCKTGGDSKELPPSKAKSSIAITQQALASSSSSPTHPHQLSNSTISTSPNMGSGNFQQQQQQQTGFNLIGPSDRHLQGFLLTRQQKKHRNNPEMQNSPSSISNDPGGSGGFGTYSILGPDHHRYHHHHQLAAGQPYNGSNGFSLTLGLPHGESLSLSPGQNIDQLGRGLGLGSSEQADFCGLQANPQLNNSQSTAGGGAYEAMEIQNRKRFAAQLLPDFFT